MTTEVTEQDYPAFREWWNRTNEDSLEDYGYRPGNPIFRAFVEKVGGDPVSGCILIPCISNGILHGHHAHIASEHRSKALITFCRAVMQGMAETESLKWICVETQGNPKLRKVEKLVHYLGFEPVLVQPQGWVDYLWNSKTAA